MKLLGCDGARGTLPVTVRTQGVIMPLQTLAPVHATHDIQRGHNVVKHGWHGRVVDSFPNWSSTTYSVEFAPEDDPAAVVTMSGLTELDVQPD